jgi:hypothetical protein
MNPIKIFALRALARMDGQPLSMDALRSTLRLAFPQSAVGDLDRAVRELEDDGYVTGATVDLVGLVWALSPKGKLKANELR